MFKKLISACPAFAEIFYQKAKIILDYSFIIFTFAATKMQG